MLQRTSSGRLARLPIAPLVVSLCAAVCQANVVVFPADSGVIDVTRPPYGAKGDGVTDDTAAIQKALDDHPSQNAIIYLRHGTYLVSDTLRWPAGRHGGVAQKRTSLQGQSAGGTTLKLKDNCPGFGDPAHRRAVIWTGQRPAQRFRNGIRTLTVDTGRGNPGACGIQYIANNQGSIRGVTIRSGDGEGVIGLDLGYTDEQGPCLIQDVTVEGFDVGISARTAVDSITMQSIRLVGQRTCGLKNDGQCVSIEGLTSLNEVPAVQNVGPVSVMTLIGATLRGRGNADSTTAIENGGVLYARNVTADGYRGVIAGEDSRVLPEYLSHACLSMFVSPAKGLGLPIKRVPKVPRDDLADWVSPLQFGGRPDGRTDSTEAIQQAIDAGKPTVYLPNGRWLIDGDVLVRAKVRRITGCEARVSGKGTFRVVDGDPPEVVIERLSFLYSSVGVEQASDRTLVISGVTLGKVGYRNTGHGDLFLEDVCSGPMRFRKQNVWARQLNVENDGTHILNDGAKLWILGYKTERAGTLIETRSGGKTELLGGFAYATSRPKTEPMFIADESSLSVTIGESCFNGNPFITLVEETRGGRTRRLYRGMAPGRTGGSVLPLYVGYEAPEHQAGPRTTPLKPRPAPPIPGASTRTGRWPAEPAEPPAPPLGKATFPADTNVVVLEDFEACEVSPPKGKPVLLNGRAGWVVDLPDGIRIIKPTGPNDTQAAARIHGRGNSTDRTNYRVAERLFDDPGFQDDQVVFYAAWMMSEPGAYGVAGWETNVGPRVPRTKDQPLTVHQYANPLGMGPQFGIARVRDASGESCFRVKPVGGDWIKSKQAALPNHWYELRLVVRQDPEQIGKSTGTLYYRDVTAGEREFSLSSIKDVPLGLTDDVKPARLSGWVFQGKHAGQYDNFAWGVVDGEIAVRPLDKSQ